MFRWKKRGMRMPMADVIVLAGIVFAFVAFAAALAWADYQTRRAARE